MKPFEVEVQSQTLEPLGRPAVWVSWSGIQMPIKPGQFLLIHTDRHHALAEAFLPVQIRSKSVLLELPADAHLSPGDRLALWGPAGKPFSQPADSSKWLLLAPFHHPGRLLPLVEAGLERGASVAVWTAQPIPVMPPAVELLASASDGLAWADYAAIDMGDSVSFDSGTLKIQDLEASNLRTIEVLRTPQMPCGFGGCGVCAVKVRHGWRLACLDGPVFDLDDLEL